MSNEDQTKPDSPKTPTNPLVLALAALIASRRKVAEQQNETGDKLATLLAAQKKLSEVKANDKQS